MKRLALLLLLFVTSFAYSAGKCYQWQQGGGPWLDSAQAVAEELVAYCNSDPANGTNGACTNLSQLSCGSSYGACTSSVVSVTATAFPTYTVVVQTYRAASDTQPAGGPWQRTLTLNYRENPNGCPDCATSGTKTTSTGVYSGSIPASKCIDSCLYTLSSEVSVILGNTYAADYKSMGSSCAQTASSNGAESGAEGDCTFQNGLVACRERSSGADCNSYNGDIVCTKNVQNGCIETASGIVACVKGTAPYPTGSAPNNGTAGAAAVPVATQTYGDPATATNQQKTDIYDSTTANNSAGGGTGSNASSGGSSSSSGSGGSSSSSASSGSSSSGSTCTSDCGFTQPANEDVPTVSQTASTYSSRINNAPIMQAVSGIGASLPSGACPSGSVTLFGHSITLDIQCTLWDQIAPILSLVFLAGWAFTGLRIIMSA